MHRFLLIKEPMSALRLGPATPPAYFQGDENVITFFFFFFFPFSQKRQRWNLYTNITSFVV